MFTSILSSVEGNLTMQNGLLCTVVSVVLGVLIAVIYMQQGNYSKNFVVTLAMMPVLVQVVIMLVNGNVGTSVAVLGTFGLVRFRSVPGTSREIANIFFAMAVGLANGMGYLTFSVAMVVVIGGMFLLLGKTYLVRENIMKRICGSQLQRIWIIRIFLKIFLRNILQNTVWSR